MTAATLAVKAQDPSWAWAPYQPDAERPWDLQQAGHLYRRAAFGATWDQLQKALAEGPQPSIDRLLHPPADSTAFNQKYDDYERTAAASADPAEVRAWWLRRLIGTPHPLLEQMTLFWHNHLAISNARVNHPALMCRYLRGLRNHALGRMDRLIEQVLSEPAVFLGLEARAHRKMRPNEHFARVLLEQYTVGRGGFNESDVQAVARAYTGWLISQNELRFLDQEHDGGTGTLFGQKGQFESKDVVRLLVRQPATARLMVRKLYRWFISENPPIPDNLLAPLAMEFAKNQDVARLVETLLRSNLFFSPAAYRQKIKSPVEFALGLIRPLEGTVGTLPLGPALAELGQDLLEPPTTCGWAGHRFWINRYTLVGRANLARSLLSGAAPFGSRIDPASVAARCGYQTPKDAGRFLCDLFIQAVPPFDLGPLRPAGVGDRDDLRQVATLLAASPVFQLA